jgi:hypothetical protein
MRPPLSLSTSSLCNGLQIPLGGTGEDLKQARRTSASGATTSAAAMTALSRRTSLGSNPTSVAGPQQPRLHKRSVPGDGIMENQAAGEEGEESFSILAAAQRESLE